MGHIRYPPLTSRAMLLMELVCKELGLVIFLFLLRSEYQSNFDSRSWLSSRGLILVSEVLMARVRGTTTTSLDIT
jgi:hypothetical protein